LIYQNRLIDIIKNDPDLSENTLIDNNRITEIIKFSAFFKILKLVITIFNVTIIIGTIQYIYYVIVDRNKK
jgi:hypothetical protein